MQIDLNSDVGESLGAWQMGDDARLMPLVSSVNVACGAHAGDPLTIHRTIAVAVAHGIAIGAHPGYPDLVGFGRRDLDMTADELEASIVYQVGALEAFARVAGSELRHVKPHGALYNRAARDRTVAMSIARAVRAISPDLLFVGLAGSSMLNAAADAGLVTTAEAFADRAYEPDGSLRSRRLAGALLPSPEAAADQAVSIARDGRVQSTDGSWIDVRADTICIHGDTPRAVDVAIAVRAALEDAGIAIAPVGGPS